MPKMTLCLGQKSARFHCKNALNLPHCTYFTPYRGGGRQKFGVPLEHPGLVSPDEPFNEINLGVLWQLIALNSS